MAITENVEREQSPCSSGCIRCSSRLNNQDGSELESGSSMQCCVRNDVASAEIDQMSWFQVPELNLVTCAFDLQSDRSNRERLNAFPGWRLFQGFSTSRPHGAGIVVPHLLPQIRGIQVTQPKGAHINHSIPRPVAGEKWRMVIRSVGFTVGKQSGLISSHSQWSNRVGIRDWVSRARSGSDTSRFVAISQRVFTVFPVFCAIFIIIIPWSGRQVRPSLAGYRGGR